MKEMLLNIFKIIIFIFIFIFLYVFLTYIKKVESVDLRNIVGFYGEEKNSLDVVYVGSSAAFVYWAPVLAYDEFGIASYAYGSNTFQVEAYKYLVKEVLKTQDPKLIIIDARPFQFREKDQPPTSVAYRNFLTGMNFSINKFEFIEENIPKYLKDETLYYHLDLGLYHTARGAHSFKRTYEMMFNKYQNKLKGFHFVHKAMRMKKLKFKTDVETPVDAETVDILDDLLHYLKTLNNEILFIVSPYIETEKEKENFNFLESKIEDAGFNFIDANEDYKKMDINYDTDFYNDNHMNIYGAEKYTRFLANYLKENYNLPDRREDDDYNSWDDLINTWEYYVYNAKNDIDAILEGKYYYDEIHVKEQ